MTMTIGYIGSYTKENGAGTYQFELDETTGKITTLQPAVKLEASTYINQFGNAMYAISKEDGQCGVTTLDIEENGALTYRQQCLVSDKGTGCYINVSPDGNYVFEAVYGAGLARLYRREQDGTVGKLITELGHQYPTGPNEERQDAPHVHYLDVTPDEKYAVAIDLGTDRLVTYQYDEQGLQEYKVSTVQPGDGPRHITFHSNGKYGYLVHELSNMVSVVAYDDGQFEEITRYSTLPESYDGATKLAAVRLSHDEKFLYISNRGHDSIAVFEVLESGKDLKLVDIVESGGEGPRDFNITPSDDYIVVAHQEGDSVVTVFKRDTATGKLTLQDNSQHAAEGVCVQFLN